MNLFRRVLVAAIVCFLLLQASLTYAACGAGLFSFRPFAGIRDRVAARREARGAPVFFPALSGRSHGAYGSAGSGCSDCAAEGVGPDGFPLKKTSYRTWTAPSGRVFILR